MNMFRFILLFVLFYLVYYIIRIFIVNYRIGGQGKGNIHAKKKPESKYDNIEEAEFTEIKKKDENSEK